jgi:hypothetical protein
MTPTLLPSLPPEGELGSARVRPSLPESSIPARPAAKTQPTLANA